MNHPSTTAQLIMIIEDSEDDYEATIRAFKKINLHNPVMWCKSGEEALDYLKQERTDRTLDYIRPGMILLDLNMPGLDGRKTLQFIKENPAVKNIPVIILTTSADERDIEVCYQIGANSYVQKPVDFDGLIEAIKRLKEYWFEIALLPKEGSRE